MKYCVWNIKEIQELWRRKKDVKMMKKKNSNIYMFVNLYPIELAKRGMSM